MLVINIIYMLNDCLEISGACSLLILLKAMLALILGIKTKLKIMKMWQYYAMSSVP